LVLAILIYAGSACRQNKTFIRLSPDGGVRISYGPLPLVLSTRLRQAELGYAQAYHHRSPKNNIRTWQVALFSKAGREIPLTLGGLASDAEAQDLEKTVKELLQLPDKSVVLKKYERKFAGRS
jgi:hypothetical protein